MEVQVLGALRVSRPDGSRAHVGPTKERVVLGTLALRAGRVVPLSVLVDKLWGDRPPPAAVSTLRTYVSHLRRVVGAGHLVAEAGGYRLVVGADELDAFRFEVLAGEGTASLDAGDLETAASRLGEALALWRGEVLADLPSGAVDAAEVARLTELQLSALARWAEAEIGLGRHSTVVPALERALALHPLDERLWAQLLVALYRSGRQSEALMGYERLRAVLRENLGIEPSAELQRLHVALLQRDFDIAVRMSVGPQGLLPFVGREAELRRLASASDEAFRGRGSVILVGGEPGVGKSRLAEEFRALMGDLGVLALSGRAPEDAVVPWRPWLDVVDGLIRRLPRSVMRSVLGDEGSDLVPLLPHLGRTHPDLRPALLPPGQEFHARLVAFVGLLDRVAARRPLLVILDDLHWADGASIALIETLLDRIADGAIIVLGLYRDAPADVSAELTRLQELVLRHPRGEVLKLPPLSVHDVAVLLRARLGREPSASLVREMRDRSDGNPFFLTELLREGERTRTSEAIPEAVGTFVRRRCAGLTADAVALVTAAAVAGTDARWEVLVDVVGLDESALLDAIDEATRAGLLREEGDDRTTTLSFSHDLVRHCVLSDLGPARHRHLHLAVGEVLERLAETEPSRFALQIAHHFLAAGGFANHDRTISWLERAADVAREAGSPGMAADHLHTARELLSASNPRRLAELDMARGWALASAGRVEEALDTWDTALSTWEAVGETDRVGVACQDLCLFLYQLGRRREFWMFRQRGLDALGDDAHTAGAALSALGASILAGSGRPADAEIVADEASRLVSRLGMNDSLAHRVLLVASALLAQDRLEIDVAGDFFTAALREPLPQDWRPLDVRGYLATVRVLQARWVEADVELRRLDRQLVRMGAFGAVAKQVSLEAGELRTAIAAGDIGAVDDISRRCLEHAMVHKLPTADASWCWRGRVALWRGDDREAAVCFDAAIAASQPSARPGLGEAGQILLAGRRGESAKVKAIWQEFEEILVAACRPSHWWFILTAAEALAVVGHAAEAAALHPLVMAALERGCRLRGNDLTPVASVAALTALAADHEALAKSLLREAAALTASLPLPLHTQVADQGNGL